MRIARRIGSAIKRAVLFVPRLVASGIHGGHHSRATNKGFIRSLQNTKRYNLSELHLNPHTGLDERVVRKVENVQTLASSQVDIIARRKQVLGNEHKVRKVENLAPGIVLSDKYDTQNTSRYDMSENLYTQKPKTGILRGLWNNPALEIAMLRGYIKAKFRRPSYPVFTLTVKGKIDKGIKDEITQGKKWYKLDNSSPTFLRTIGNVLFFPVDLLVSVYNYAKHLLGRNK